MELLAITFAWISIIGGGFLAWTYTKRGKKWLENL